MKHVSIKWRMTVWFAIVMIAITTLMLVFVMLINRNTVTRPPDAEVMHIVQRNADDIERDHGQWDFSDVEMYAHGVYTEIFSADGKRLAGASVQTVDMEAPHSESAELKTVRGSDGNEYYVYDLWYEMYDTGLWVRGTISASEQGSVMEVIVPLAWILLPALVVLSILGGWLISSLSFRPLEKVIASAESISGGEDLSKRIGLPRGKSEINRLAGAFDDMFDRLEQSFEAEMQFTSDASHELRTPVTVILAECETLENGTPTAEEYAEGIETISGQARQMSTLISQLLHITRLEQGTQKANFESADLGELAQLVCQQQETVAPKGMKLVCSAESVTLPVDIVLMTRLLNNLIGNAFSYGRENGHVAVTVRKEKNAAVLSVTDDGIGIATNEQERIWQRFYQVDSARSNGDSAGLGLYMVRQIAHLHGGEAYVSSVPGKGSTFTVRLPFTEQ